MVGFNYSRLPPEQQLGQCLLGLLERLCFHGLLFSVNWPCRRVPLKAACSLSVHRSWGPSLRCVRLSAYRVAVLSDAGEHGSHAYFNNISAYLYISWLIRIVVVVFRRVDDFSSRCGANKCPLALMGHAKRVASPRILHRVLSQSFESGSTN